MTHTPAAPFHTAEDPGVVIRDYLIENFLFGDDQVLEDDASLIETGILDSTGVIELVAFLEERFAIQVHDEDLVPENLDSIGRLVRFVRERTNAWPTTDRVA